MKIFKVLVIKTTWAFRKYAALRLFISCTLAFEGLLENATEVDGISSRKVEIVFRR